MAHCKPGPGYIEGKYPEVVDISQHRGYTITAQVIIEFFELFMDKNNYKWGYVKWAPRTDRFYELFPTEVRACFDGYPPLLYHDRLTSTYKKLLEGTPEEELNQREILSGIPYCNVELFDNFFIRENISYESMMAFLLITGYMSKTYLEFRSTGEVNKDNCINSLINKMEAYIERRFIFWIDSRGGWAEFMWAFYHGDFEPNMVSIFNYYVLHAERFVFVKK